MLYKAIKKAYSQGGLRIASTAVDEFAVYQKVKSLQISPGNVLILLKFSK